MEWKSPFHEIKQGSKYTVDRKLYKSTVPKNQNPTGVRRKPHQGPVKTPPSLGAILSVKASE